MQLPVEGSEAKAIEDAAIEWSNEHPKDVEKTVAATDAGRAGVVSTEDIKIIAIIS